MQYQWIHTEVTCRSVVRNSAELRRFSSPHPSLFFWIFRLKWQWEWRRMAARAYMEGRDPVAPPHGRQAPVARCGGATSPLHFFFAQGPPCEFEKKITLRPVALWGRPGVFLKFLKMDIYFWNFDFFKYKKEKSAPSRPHFGSNWKPGDIIRPNSPSPFSPH